MQLFSAIKSIIERNSARTVKAINSTVQSNRRMLNATRYQENDPKTAAIKNAIEKNSAIAVKTLQGSFQSQSQCQSGLRQQAQMNDEQSRKKDKDDDRRYFDKRFNRLEEMITTALSRGELNIALDRLKKSEEEKKILEQQLLCTEMELKQNDDMIRTLTATLHQQRLEAAKPCRQPPAETTAPAHSIAKHTERISGAHSTTKRRRSSNPGNLRRSSRNLKKSKK
eukprot:scaffold14319_cov148-Skeletonema_menzelii.AAC.1